MSPTEHDISDADRLSSGIIDVGQVPLRTSVSGARIEWDGVNGLVQYDANNNVVTHLSLDGDATFSGHLEGATGTFTGVIQGGEIIQRKGDDYIKLSDRKLSSVSYSQTQTQGVEIFTNNIVLYSHSGKPDTTSKIVGINLDSNGISFKFDPESQYFDDAGINGSYNPFLDETYLALAFDRVGVAGGSLKLENASGTSNALEFPNDHLISNHVGDFTFYGNRATGRPFKIRSHNNRGSYRNDFWIGQDGTIFSNPTYTNTSSNNANVRIAEADGNYRFYRATSAKKYKHDIQLSDVDPYKILDLEIKSWYDKREYEENGESTDGLRRYHALVADDVADVLPEFADYNHEGEVENYNDRVFSLLIPIVKDILERLDKLETN